jgi:hypothetical protein
VLLDTHGLLPRFPLEVATIATWKHRSQAFAPFHPEVGYQVTREDFEAGARREKVVTLSRENNRDIVGHPLVLGVYADGRDLASLGLVAPDERYHNVYRFGGDAWSIISRLSLQVQANGLRFASRVDRGELSGGDIAFHDAFYPFDSGPLAVLRASNGTPLYSEGVQIALPDHPDLLATMAGRITLPGIL